MRQAAPVSIASTAIPLGLQRRCASTGPHRRHPPPEAEQQQLDPAMRENRRQSLHRKRRLRPGLGPVGKHEHRTQIHRAADPEPARRVALDDLVSVAACGMSSIAAPQRDARLAGGGGAGAGVGEAGSASLAIARRLGWM